MFERVRHHDGALSGPEQTGAHTEKGAGEDVEAGDMLMLRDEETNGVNRIADSTEGKREAHTKTVDDRSSEETHHGEGTVQGNILLLLDHRPIGKRSIKDEKKWRRR